MRGECDGKVVAFVVGRRSKFIGCQRVLRITRIVAERTAILVVAHGARQGVVCYQVRPVEGTLTVGEVHPIVARTADRHLVTYASEKRLTGCRERSVQRTEEAARCSRPAERSDVVRR